MKTAIEHYEAALKEAFPSGATGDVFHHWNEARKALEQPAQDKPVAWRSWNDYDGYGFWETKQEAEPWCAPDFFAEPLYTHPAPKWVDLTDKEITKTIAKMPNGIDGYMRDWDLYEFTRAIEAKLREKNT